jgi:flagellar assembly protein FliH
MMTSPFELADAAGATVAGRPVKLWDRQARDGKVISRLEFQSAEKTVVEVIEQVESGAEPDEVELRVKEEMAALNMQSQTQQVLSRIDTARSEAKVEARREWEEELEEKIAAEREGVLRSCEQFGRERARYFAGVEAEVVKLALAIAARVLHREAKLDPLLLSAAVRVALEKVAEDSAMVLRVPAAEVELWRGVFSAQAFESSVKVVGDERLGVGECVLDTNVGKVELGVSAQLSEIERGFFDLLQQRPA